MDIFVVYHKKEPNFMDEPNIINPHDYEYVATVHANDLEDVFRITNNIDMDWQLNPEVIKTADKKGFRSTSVGDLVISIPTFLAADITVNMVCGSGFKTVVVSGDN